MDQAVQIFGRFSVKKALWGLFFLHILFHLPMLNTPPVGLHYWRQIVGHSMARNYFTEPSSFLESRVDIRTEPEDSGIIYHEFPLTYWLAGQSYALFGVQNITPRLIALLFNLLLIFFAYRLARVLEYDPEKAFLFSFLLTSAPLYFYYSVALTPDILGLTFFIGGLAYFLSSLKEKGFSSFLFGTGLLILGTLCKPTYLFFGLAVAVPFFILLKKERKLAILWRGLAAGTAVLATNAYILRQSKIFYDQSPSERQLHTPIGPAESFGPLKEVLEPWLRAVTTWFIEVEVGYLVLPAFLVGLWQVWQAPRFRSFSAAFWLSWFVGFCVYFYFFGSRFAHHDYYMTCILPIVAILSAGGLLFISKKPWFGKRLLYILALIFLAGYIRVAGRWFFNPGLPNALVYQGRQISQDIPEKDLIFVGGDKTPNAYFYFLERKGVSLNNRIHAHIKDLPYQNFKWLVQNRDKGPVEKELFSLYSVELVRSVAEFDIYRLTSLVSKG